MNWYNDNEVQFGQKSLKVGTITSVGSRHGRYQNMDGDTISICKASIYQHTQSTFSLNLCKFIKYTAFSFNFLCFGDLNLSLFLKTATL